MANDPKKGEGWNFMDDESEAWYDALETTEDEEGNTRVDVDAYDEFGNIQDIVNFIAGTGTYNNTRRFTPGEEDLNMKKREMHNDQWKIPGKLEQISEYLEQEDDITPNEIDLDPNAEAAWNVSETEAHMDGYETKYTAHFIAYNPEENGNDENAHFYISGSWYDTPPEEMNIEKVFQTAFQE